MWGRKQKEEGATEREKEVPDICRIVSVSMSKNKLPKDLVRTTREQ